mgnify:CR=1 FL=1
MNTARTLFPGAMGPDGFISCFDHLMDDALLRRIGRVHTYEQVQQAVEAARKAKLKNLSLDLIYGLPRSAQTASPRRSTSVPATRTASTAWPFRMRGC